MANKLRIAGISGSLREGSYNTHSLRAAAEVAPEDMELDIITLHDQPLYNRDVEERGWPEPVAALRERVAKADAVLFATPEYNYGIPGVLKNAIDWLSRPEGDAPLNGKPAAIIGATPSMVGTARAQSHMREFAFYNAMPLLCTHEILFARAGEKFDSSGALVDFESRRRLGDMMIGFGEWIRSLRSRV